MSTEPDWNVYPESQVEPWTEHDFLHGTTGGYTNHQCRCADCSAAWRAYCRKRRVERLARGLADDDDRHGSYNGYVNYGCRCAACCQAASERYYRRTYA